MRELLGGEEAEAFESSLAGEPETGLRVNTLKLPAAEFERLSPWQLEPVTWCPSGYRLRGDERPGLHPFHAAGLFYLQEPSAMAVAEALAPEPGELVLDLAAAPGGKSTHLAALLGDQGVLVANDVNAPRARELSRNLERWGSRTTLVTSAAPVELADRWGAVFDAVLLDAPCSGEGMFRKTPQALEQWSPELVESCAVRQVELLEAAARLVKPGGRLAYSTCTFEPAENEQVVAGFLASHGDWKALPAGLAGVEPAVARWAPGTPRSGELSRAARLWPHLAPGEGHFVALLRRSPSSEAESTRFTGAAARRVGPRGARTRRSRKSSGTDRHEAVRSWLEFVGENLRRDPVPEHELHLRDDGLYALPPGSPSLEGLRVLRPGVWLGRSERGRFMPSHSLALTLRSDEAVRRVDLGADDPRLTSYLQGAELESSGDDGWTLVGVAGHPLGWGRRARNIVKNHYPKGLRRPTG